MMGCTPTAINCYTAISNTTIGMDGLFNHLRDSMMNYPPTSIIGGSIIGIMILMPVFLIIFIPLSRTRFSTALTSASFICLILTIPLLILQYVNVAAFGLFLALTVIGALVTFNQDR